MRPRVSVGMPVYNGEDYVGAAIDSVLAQTLDDLELVISDNASTDATEEICRDRAARDARVRYVRQDRNRGYVENFNEVFRRTRGPLFAWAAADDLRAPTFLERCLEVLDARPDVVLAMPRTVPIDADGEVTTADVFPGPGTHPTPYTEYTNLDGPRSVGDPDPVVRFRRLMRDLWYTVQLYGVIRSDVLARTGLHPAHSLGDHILLSELVLHGPFAEIDEPLFLRRVHDQRTTDMSSLRRRVATVRGQEGQVGALALAGAYVERLRLHAEGVNRAPLSARQRAACHATIAAVAARWAVHRASRLTRRATG